MDSRVKPENDELKERAMLRKIGLKSEKKELGAYLDLLKGMHAEEIGMTLALAFSYRNTLLANSGIDLVLLDSDKVSFADVAIRIRKNIKDLQKKGDQKSLAIAGALMIWLHSIRVGSMFGYSELRYLGKEMWENLERGFPYVLAQADFLQNELKYELDLSEINLIPEQLNPNKN